DSPISKDCRQAISFRKTRRPLSCGRISTTRGGMIDELFQLAPDEFTAARNALAKTLTGDAARDVKALKKPSAVAWAVNQLFWKARPIYDALMKAGHALRAAQIAALKGRKGDVRATTEKHRKAVADAVKRAQQIAKQ